MIDKGLPRPAIVLAEQWLSARRQLLEREKELKRQYDNVSAERRRLPMVRIEKLYQFTGPNGGVKLGELFDGRRQLIVYHFMFAPDSDEGCPACTSYVAALGDLSLLSQRDTAFALISRAPFAKLDAYEKRKRWSLPWYSSSGSDFNYDFHVTLDERVAPVEYNYRTKAEMLAHHVPNQAEGEEHGISVFFRCGDDVFHTYSAYARGTEGLTDAYSLLDLTPYGRQEDWEESPLGWPQKPTYG